MSTDTSNAEAQPDQAATADTNQGFSPEEIQGKATGTQPASLDVNLDLVMDVPVNVSLKVGSTEMPIKDLVRLVEGSVIALDREASAPMDVLVNGKLIAHGEIVLVDDHFGVRLTEVVNPVDRLEQLA